MVFKNIYKNMYLMSITLAPTVLCDILKLYRCFLSWSEDVGVIWLQFSDSFLSFFHV